MVIMTEQINIMIKIISKLFLLVLLIIPGEVFSQSNFFTDTQIQRIEQNVLEALVNENHEEFLRHLEQLRSTGIPVHHELLYYEAEAHYQLSNFSDAQIAIGFYLDHSDGRLNQKRNAESLLSRLEDSFIEMREREDRFYQRALRNRHLSDVNQYLQQYPDGRYKDEVSELADNISFEQARRTNTRDAYGLYLREFPDGNHIKEAQIRYDQLERLNVLNRQENELNRVVSRDLNQRNHHRKRSIQYGLLGAGSIVVANLFGNSEDGDLSMAYNVLGGVIILFSAIEISKTVKLNRSITSTRQKLLEVENEKEQLRNSISFRPHINPMEGSYALSLQIRF